MRDLERSSLRGLERTFGVSRSTMLAWIKKKPLAAAIERAADLSRSHRCCLNDLRAR